MNKVKLTRRSFVGLGAGAAALGLSGCSGASNSSDAGSDADSATGVQHLSFVLDYAPNVNHTGIYVALNQGWYTEEGIDLEIVPVPDTGSDALIGSGGADLGMSYQDVMANSLGSDNPMPYTAIAATVQHNTSGIMSRKEDDITHPAAMQGHRYATWGQDVEQATVRQVVEDDGGSWDKIELVPYEVDDEVQGLQADLFDTVWVYEWWAVKNAELKDYPVNYFAFRDINETFDYYTPVICVNDDFAEKNPELVRAFLRATKRGYEYAAENPDEAATILCDEVPELDQDLISLAQKTISPLYISDAENWGTIDEARWSRFYQWLNDHSLVANPLDVSAGYTLDYLA